MDSATFWANLEEYWWFLTVLVLLILFIAFSLFRRRQRYRDLDPTTSVWYALSLSIRERPEECYELKNEESGGYTDGLFHRYEDFLIFYYSQRDGVREKLDIINAGGGRRIEAMYCDDALTESLYIDGEKTPRALIPKEAEGVLNATRRRMRNRVDY